jgi:galactose-1-phosphate uridylyltransferase
MAPLYNPGGRLWRTDFRVGRNIYALLSNDVTKTSTQDPLIGTMETSELAEIVVETHNKVLLKFGRHYLKALATDD